MNICNALVRLQQRFYQNNLNYKKNGTKIICAFCENAQKNETTMFEIRFENSSVSAA